MLSREGTIDRESDGLEEFFWRCIPCGRPAAFREEVLRYLAAFRSRFGRCFGFVWSV
jgi:hypothetical protein